MNVDTTADKRFDIACDRINMKIAKIFRDSYVETKPGQMGGILFPVTTAYKPDVAICEGKTHSFIQALCQMHVSNPDKTTLRGKIAIHARQMLRIFDLYKIVPFNEAGFCKTILQFINYYNDLVVDEILADLDQIDVELVAENSDSVKDNKSADLNNVLNEEDVKN